MNITQLETLLQSDKMDSVISLLETRCLINAVDKALRQYNPKTHDVTRPEIRQDKIINGEEDEKTGAKSVSIVTVARLTLPIQKKIVLTAAAFLGTPTLDTSPKKGKETDLLAVIKKTWADNKLDYKFKKLAKHTMSEKECAEIWYTQDITSDPDYWNGQPISKSAKYKLGMKLLAPSLGDSLYPVFDDYGAMIAFGRAYKVFNEESVEIRHFDVYTAKTIYYTREDNGVWKFSADGITYDSTEKLGVANIVGKIPIIYYCQPLTEWDDVQPLIDRLETKISNHADTNDYFDRPMLVGYGDTISLPEKGENGKYVEVKGVGGKLEYLTWDQAPASMKMEIENLEKFIYSYTNTPDVSFSNLKNLGYFSNIALQTMFMDAHLKAADKEEIFGEGVQRRINYLKVAISKIDSSFTPALILDIKPKFEYFLPKNVQEIITTLAAAVGAGIMTKDTAVRQNPLVGDPDTEIEALKEAAVVLPNPPIATPVNQN